MPRGRGGKKRGGKRGRGRGGKGRGAGAYELIFKEEGQEYAQVLRVLGNGRFEVMCFDGKTRLAHIRGKLRKRSRLAPEDILLVSLRDFQDDKADIIVAYSPDEARQLKMMGELPDDTNINEGALDEDDEEAFVFEAI